MNAVSVSLMRLLEQYAADPMPWAVFLPVFEQWCLAQGWAVEYHLLEDGSCAIFSCQASGWDEEKSQSNLLASPFLDEDEDSSPLTTQKKGG